MAFSLPMLGRLARKNICWSCRVSVGFIGCIMSARLSMTCSCLAAV